jgi:hypothetical protein
VTFTEFRSIMESRGPVQRDGRDWRGRCPVCNDTGKRGNLAFREGDGGHILIHCWSGCKFDSIVATLGLKPDSLFPDNGNGYSARRLESQPRAKTTYASPQAAGSAIAERLGGQFTEHWLYRNQDGSESFIVLRFDNCDGEKPKSYRPLHWNGAGYVEGDPPKPLVLYRLPELVADVSGPVFIAEGEKAAEAARSIGLLATTSAHGADSPDKTDWRPLAGRSVVILPDADEAGHRYAEKVTGILLELNPPACVRIVTLPDLPPGGDIYDFTEERDDSQPAVLREQIMALVDQAPFEVPGVRDDAEASAPKLMVCNASLWLVTEPPEPDQILADTFDKGDKVVLLGSPKVRKSFALLQLMESLAAGRDCWGWSVPKARRVVGVQFEIQGHHFHRRVRRMATGLGLTPADLGDRLQIINARGLGLCGPEGIKRILEAVKPLEPDVICLDPLYKLLVGKENAAEDLKVTLNMFDELAEATGAAIVYVHHDAKGFSGDRDIRDRGAGSNVLGRDYDACVTLTPHASEPDAVVVETLLRNYRPQEPFTVTWTEDATSGGYCFITRSDIAPTKQTSTTARKQNATPFDALQPVALELLAGSPLAISDFKHRMKTKCGLTRDRTDEFTRWSLLKAETPLDVYETRGKGKHVKYIGTAEQIAQIRDCSHA